MFKSTTLPLIFFCLLCILFYLYFSLSILDTAVGFLFLLQLISQLNLKSFVCAFSTLDKFLCPPVVRRFDNVASSIWKIERNSSRYHQQQQIDILLTRITYLRIQLFFRKNHMCYFVWKKLQNVCSLINTIKEIDFNPFKWHFFLVKRIYFN